MIILFSKSDQDERLVAAGFTFEYFDKDGFEVWDYEGTKCLAPDPYTLVKGEAKYCAMALNSFIMRMTGNKQRMSDLGTMKFIATDSSPA
jgi:hypothetical protein